MQHLPAAAVLAEHLLGEPLTDFFARERAKKLSWELVARALWEATDKQVSVTGMTVQNWAKRADAASNGKAEGAA